tara:strand:+ start:1375 stop:1803 length:429 start_codon:yes stop_codon:yes gene_type:complete
MDRAMSGTVEPDWDAVRAEYEAGKVPISEIAARHGVSRSGINARVKAKGWPMRKPTVGHTQRTTLIRRMFRVLERQLNLLDEEMTSVSNTEVTMLGNLVRSLDKLIDLDNAERKIEKTKRPSAEMAAIKQRLAERMAEIERK